ncbi:Cytoplasmic tRNA 2-thiolation protein 2 [Dipsacomyces acuminosporus]|nr:Cytoplasmic tRNA 2-thiolation protein 2 [Dipsacomyces acuminosporus]
MCDATEAENVNPRRYERKRVPGLCIKCKTAKPNVDIRRCLYCKECFVRATITKFRAALSKSRQRVKVPRTRALIAFSGGATSSALLRLMLDYHSMDLKGTGAETVYSGLVVGHVDESALFPGIQSDEIHEIAKETGLQYEVAKLEDVFDLDDDQSALLELVQSTVTPGAARDQFCVQLVRHNSSISSKNRLISMFDGLGSMTNKEDMLASIKNFLLLRLARKHQCGVIMMGDSATRIATKIISLTSRGRGFSLPLEVCSESTWFDDVAIYRPMRDCITKEIAFFNRWTRQRSAVAPTFTTMLPAKASIDRLTEAFVVGLDRDFPSTVSTVCRTLQKLEPRQEALHSLPCIMCGMPVESSAQEWRDRLTVSSTPNGAVVASSPAAAANSPSVRSAPNESKSPLLDITAYLCYSCQNLFHSAKPGTAFPGFCFSRFNEHISAQPSQPQEVNGDKATETDEHREQLRKQIEEFLIDDDDADLK